MRILLKVKNQMLRAEWMVLNESQFRSDINLLEHDLDQHDGLWCRVIVKQNVRMFIHLKFN